MAENIEATDLNRDLDVEFKFTTQFLEAGQKLGYKDEKLQTYVAQKVKDALDRHNRAIERAHERDVAEREAQEKDKEREAQREREAAEREAQEKEREAQERIAEREAQKEIELARIEADRHARIQDVHGEGDRSGFESSLHSAKYPKLPNFKEKTDHIDSYIYRFEVQANGLKWPKERWLSSPGGYCIVALS